MIAARQSQSYPDELVGTAILSSDRAVCVRPVGPQDAELARSYLRKLSPASRYSRFMAAVDPVPDGWIEQFSQVSGESHLSLMASIFGEGAETMIGEAQYAVDGCGTSAELALSVADAWQNDGLGSHLLQRLEESAAQAGITRLYCDTLGSNYAMRRVLRNASFALAGLCAGLFRFEKVLKTV